MRMSRLITVLLAVVYAFPAVKALGEEFVYHSQRFPSQFERSTARLLRFTEQLPPDVEVRVKFAGKHQSFGQFFFGSNDSTSIAAVVDRLGEGDRDFDLYLDLNRDRIIDADEQVEGDGRIWFVELEAEVNSAGDVDRHPRKVAIRRMSGGDGFTVRTVGGFEGPVKLTGKTVASRRIDGDGNGLFADPKDQLWIDLNQDGEWDPIAERFPFQTMLNIDGRRFAVRGDRLGQRLSLEQVEGEGLVQVQFALEDSTAKVTQLSVSLYGDDGASFTIASGNKLTLPVGKYMVGSFSVVVADAESRQPWYFSFSHSGRKSEQVWYSIEKGQETSIELPGEFEFYLHGEKRVTAGKPYQSQPVLRTADGLYITASGRGKPTRDGQHHGNPARLVARDANSNAFSNCISGFR